ncbi:MAG: NADH-quinone oxidoreductase subunit NuoN [Arenicellales bacterium]
MMTLANLHLDLIAPEIFLSGAACLVLLIELFIKPVRACALAWPLSLIALLISGGVAFGQINTPPLIGLNGLVVSDSAAALLRGMSCFLTAGVLFYAQRYSQARDIWRVEYLTLALFGVVGMMTMIGSAHLLTLYVGVELLALCLYGMIAMQRDAVQAAEAAMKYFILGALASGLLLYGMSLLYGLTGTLSLASISSNSLTTLLPTSLPLMLAIVMVIAGLLFKLGAVPFHMWVPDVYEGSATGTTLYLSAVPKLAAFAILYRLLEQGLGGWIEIWQDILLLAGIFSIALGNVIAIAQTSLKRMLAYSTISHMGFLLLGFASATPSGYAASMMYALIYAVTTLAVFGVMLALSRDGFESDQLDDLRGLNQRHPWLAFLMLLVIFSLAGIPPTAGFFAKLLILQAAVEAGFLTVVVAAVLFAVVGAFYYLRVIKLMYFDSPREDLLAASAHGYRPSVLWVLTANAVLVVAITPWLGAIMDVVSSTL